VWSGRTSPTFRRNVLPPSSEFKSKRIREGSKQSASNPEDGSITFPRNFGELLGYVVSHSRRKYTFHSPLRDSPKSHKRSFLFTTVGGRLTVQILGNYYNKSKPDSGGN
jgi:hypothetical protein